MKRMLTHIGEVGGFYIRSLDCQRLNRRSVSVELTRHDPFYNRYPSKNSIILGSSRCLRDYSPMCTYFMTCCITQMTMLFVRGLVSIDTRVEVSIVARSQVSIDKVEVVSIDSARFSLRIKHSKRVGSDNTNMHVPERKENFFM